MLKSTKVFKGGYHFKNYAGQPGAGIAEVKIPPRVIIPLKQGFGVTVAPCVKKGDLVAAGQIIARDDNSVCSPIHSSVHGVVEDIRRMNYFKRDILMVVIRTSNPSLEVQKLPGFSPEWSKLSLSAIEELIYLSGVSSLDREGIPTRFKSSVISPADVNHLIVHAVGSEPYNICAQVLLEGKNFLHFFEGVKILKAIMPNARLHLALNVAHKKTIEEMLKLASDLKGLDIYALEPKYPQGYDEMLVPTLLGQRFPYGYSAANIGVVILNVSAVLGVYQAVCEGRPLVERIIAVCGPQAQESGHIRVRVGTPLSEALSGRLTPEGATRVVLNSLLTGWQLNDLSLPVDRTFSQLVAIPENKEREFFTFMRPGAGRDSYTRAFLAQWLPFMKKRPDTNKHGEERPCISCGFCEEVCPVRIIPHLLAKYVQRGIIDETIMNYNIFYCIECGLCSFVCPSKIPLVKIIKDGQDKLVMQGCDHSQCILPYFNLKGLEEYRGVTRL